MRDICAQASHGNDLVVLLVRLLRQVGDLVSRAHLLDPTHLRGVVGLERAVVNLAQALAEQETDGDAYEEVRHPALAPALALVLCDAQ